MTDSEKLDFIISKFTEMDKRSESTDKRFELIDKRLDNIDKRLDNVDKRLDNVDKRLDNVDKRLDNVDKRLDSIDKRFDTVDKRLNKLEVGQAEITKELYMLDRKISDTYKVALDALGMSTENRVWLESSGLKVYP